jgi:hypothetical protein
MHRSHGNLVGSSSQECANKLCVGPRRGGRKKVMVGGRGDTERGGHCWLRKGGEGGVRNEGTVWREKGGEDSSLNFKFEFSWVGGK